MIVLCDPGIGSRNVGDEVISQASRRQLHDQFPSEHLVRVSSHGSIGVKEASLIRRAHVTFVGGSNLLDASMRLRSWRNQWGVGAQTPSLTGRSAYVLMGVGLKTSERATASPTAKVLLRRLLRHDVVHAVRDDRSVSLLKQIGLKATNAGCPTLWGANEFPAPNSTPAARCVTTLTCYAKRPSADRAMLDLLRQRYERVSLWPQSEEDVTYLRELDPNGRVDVVAPTLTALRDALLTDGADYVGTRLHGGIRAIQLGARCTIVAVDHRALDLADTCHLPVVRRDDTTVDIERSIDRASGPQAAPPLTRVDEFFAQFTGG